MRILLVLCLSILGGCGASTIRVDLAPTVDAGGHVGVESTLSLGGGMPLDYHGRSHHYVQALGSVGGGLDGRTASAMFVAAGGLDYIYWAEPTLDVRVGARFAYRAIPDAVSPTKLYGLGSHLAILPMVVKSDYGWSVTHLCLGPELRLEYLWSDPPGLGRGMFSLPLVLELNALMAGD